MADVLREFLVSIGFAVDRNSERQAEASAKRVEQAVVAADKRMTQGQVAGSAARLIQSNREAGIRTRGAADLIQGMRRIDEANAKHTTVTVRSAKDREQADASAARTAKDRSGAVVLGLTAMATAAVAAGVQMAQAVVRVAGNMDQLYYSSQRTRASEANLRAFGYAASQLGSSVEGAAGSLETLAQKMRMSPGYESMLNQLGVSTRNNGKLRDTVDVVQDLGQAFAKMPHFQAMAYANALGIDERTMTALKSGDFAKKVGEYRDMLAKARLDPTQAAKDSADFMQVWRRMQNGLEIIGMRIEGALVKKFGGSVNKFTDWLLNNSDRIAEAFVKMGDAMLRFVDHIAGLFKAFDNLDPKTKSFLIQIAALAAALLLMRSGPLGALVAITAALVAFLDEDMMRRLGEMWEKFDALAKKLTGQDGLTVAFAALGAVLALQVVAPLLKVMTLLTGFAGIRLPPWLLGLLGVGALAGAANANGILSAGEGSRSVGESVLRTLDPGVADRVYGKTGADRAATAKDDRTLWQRIAPKALGGKDAPNGSRTIGEGERTGGSRSWRNNNPGNLKFSDATKAMGATHADDKGFAVFPNEAMGRKAQEGLLFEDPRYKGKTLAQAMQQYAPSSENDTQGYIGAVAKAAGITGDTPLSSLNPQQRSAMLDAMKKHEGWQEGQTASESSNKIKGFANLMRGQYGAPGENLTSITAPSGKRATVHKEAAESFAGFLKELEGTGYNIDSLGGYANRGQANGSGRISQHAYGNAIDINPGKNPYKTSITDMPPNVSAMAAKWGLSWGGDWSERSRDPMHFEWTGSQPWKNKAGPAPTSDNKPAAMPFGLNGKALEEMEKRRAASSSGVTSAIPRIEQTLQNFNDRFGDSMNGATKMMPGEGRPMGTWSNNSSTTTNNIRIDAPTTNQISGVGDAKQVGTEVGKAQSRVHADLLRNLQGAVA